MANGPLSPARGGSATAPSPVNMDLTSSAKTVPASALGCNNCGSLVINVGGSRLPVSRTDMLTPAQFAVAAQLLSAGSQSLQLTPAGTAASGSLNLFNQITPNINNMTVPMGVTVYASNSLRGLNLTGDLVNSGTVVGLVQPQSMLANITANNIMNALGGVLTVGALSQVGASRLSSSTMNISAAGQLVNYGLISSPGRVNITANEVKNFGGSTNVSGGIITGAAVDIQSSSGSVRNSGSITASAGSLNIYTQSAANLVVDNTSGTLAAQQSSINFGGSANPSNVAVLGGNLSGKEINVVAPGGKVNVAVESIDGVLNTEACDAHVMASTDNLVLGSMKLSGDPTFYNTAGDVTINTDLVFPGQPLTIVASRNILSAPGAGRVDTSSSTGPGGSITMLAGMDFSSSAGPVSTDPFAPVVLSVRGGSLTGGSIRLAGATPITSFDTSSTAANGSGGQIDLVAHEGALAGTGQIILPRTVTIRTGGNGTGFAGAVRMFSSVTNGVGIDVGSIDTSGGARGLMYTIPNIVQLVNDGLPFASMGHPVLITGNVSAGNIYMMNEKLAMTQGPFTITNGQYIPGSFYGDGGVLRSGSMHAEAVHCSNCTRILINGGGTVSLASLTATPTVVNNKTIMQVMLRSTTPFVIGPSATTNGVKTISANAGPLGGNAGDIRIIQIQTGGIIVDSLASISATTTNGNGGAIQLATDGDMGGLVTPPGPHGAGTLVLPSGGLIVDGAGPHGHGGTIYINAGKLLVSDSAGPLVLSANGSGDGAGGIIGITVWSSFLNSSVADIAVGHNAKELVLSATGGSPGSAGGDGGTVFVQAGRNLTVDTSAVTAGPLGTDGSGPFLLFTAGAGFATGGFADYGLPVLAGSGKLTINGALHADGVGSGAGGVLLLSSSDPSTFTVGGAPGCTHCTTGALSANGGSTAGSPGGLLGVQTYGSLILNSTPTVAPSAAGGDGGQLLLSTATGAITFNVPGLAADAAGTAADAYSGGMINISTPSMVLTGPLQLSAVAVGSGNGGNVYVEAPGGAVNLASGALTILASGGSAGSSAGSGGVVTVIASDLTVDPAALVAGPLGTNGAGAILVLQGVHRVNITNDMDVSGIGNGAGGSLTIQNNAILPAAESVYRYLAVNADGTYPSAVPADLPFTVQGGPGACNNCIAGTITANGGALSGKGGTINVTANKGIVVSSASSLSALASPGGGAGGKLLLLASSGAINLAAGSYAVDAVGGGATGFKGGQIRVEAPTINVVGLAPTSFSANGTANGGSVSFKASSGGNFTVGSDPSGLVTSFSAQGGLSGNSGNGGAVVVQTGGDLTVDPLAVTVNPAGANGKGGALTFIAGANLTVLSGLSANGVGSGDGGALTLNSNGATPFVVNGLPGCFNCVAGQLSVKPGASGTTAGSISITSGSGIVINSMADLQYAPNASGGNGGGLLLASGAGVLQLPGGSIVASAVGPGSFKGGSISLSGAQIQTAGGVPLLLIADGVGGGNGGAISYSQTTGNVVVGAGAGQVSFSANGGSAGSSSGNAGSVSVSAAGNLTVDTSAISVQALGTNGSGGALSLSAGQNLLVTGDVLANGVGSGNGGVVTLAYGIVSGLSSFLIGGPLTGPNISGVTGLIAANAPGSGGGGTVNIQTKSGSTLNLNLLSSVSTTSVGGSLGSIMFAPVSNVGALTGLNISGSGLLLGNVTAQAGRISIVLSTQTQPLTIGSLTSTSGGINLQSKSILVPTAAAQIVSNGGNVTITANTVVNNGLIQTQPLGFSIVFSSSGNLSVTGSGVLSGNVVFSSAGSTFISQGGILGSVQGSAGGGYEISLGSTFFTNGTLSNNLVSALSRSELLFSSASVNTATQTTAALLTQFIQLQPNNVPMDPVGLKKKDDSGSEQKKESEKSVVTSGLKSDTIVFTQANQIFSGSFGGGSDVAEAGSPGTVVENEKTVVYLHKGELALDTGADGVNVSAGGASIKISADSTAVVKYAPGRPVQVVVLGSKDNKPVSVTKDNVESFVGPSEQIVLSDQDLTEEELIPEDGRAVLDCHVQVQTRKMVKRDVAIDGFASRNLLIAGVLVNLPGRSAASSKHGHSVSDRMMKHLQADLPATNRGVAYVEKLRTADGTDVAVKPNKTTSAPLHFYNARGTVFSQSGSNVVLEAGSMVLAPPQDISILCDDLTVNVRKEGIVSIDKTDSAVKIKACTGLSDVQVKMAGGRTLTLPCGQELLFVKNGFERHALDDGIARRAQSTFSVGPTSKVLLTEFSIPALMLNVTHLTGISHPQTEREIQLRERLIRSAVAIQYSRAGRGRFVNNGSNTSALHSSAAQ